jgi:predicted lipoprotein with Yx(FWY)xxD motif
MHKRIPFRSLLTLSTLVAAACGEPDPAPYAPTGEDSYRAPVQNAGGEYGGGSAWVGDAVSSADAGGAASGGGGDAASAAADVPDVTLRSGALFENYLVDAQGKPLYMFANDIVGSNASACSAACLEKWPVFDAKEIAVGQGLNAADFSRFQRADGSWQSSFKGHPLYYYAADPAAGGVTGDGSGGRWFVARDYFAFLGAKSDLTPLGASTPAPFLTNRLGRTIYVFMMDSAGTGFSEPLSACNGPCLESWPTWNAPASLDNLVLPSNMDAADFDEYERSAGGTSFKQLTYRGWPLYFYAQDEAAGETSGHQMGMWRAFEPESFADGASTSQARAIPRTR